MSSLSTGRRQHRSTPTRTAAILLRWALTPLGHLESSFPRSQRYQTGRNSICPKSRKPDLRASERLACSESDITQLSLHYLKAGGVQISVSDSCGSNHAEMSDCHSFVTTIG